MLSNRLIDRNLRVTGALLFSVYLVSEISGFVLSRTGMSDYQDNRIQTAAMRQANAKQDVVSFALWSQQRIKAYKQALVMKLGSPVAVLSIPRIGMDEVPVFDGTDDLTLNRGAGLIAGTGRPGELGNVGIAAHRDGFFRGLKDIHVGDQIQLEARRGEFQYKVEDIEIVDPSNVNVLRGRTKPSLTLVTCYPFYFVGNAPMRYIVHAVLLKSARRGPA